MKKFIDLCRFSSFVRLTNEQKQLMPIHLCTTIPLLEKLIECLKIYWFRLGKENGLLDLKDIDTDMDYQLTLYIATPVDMYELLQWYENATPQDRSKALASFKNYFPKAWTSTNNLPIKDEKTLHEVEKLSKRHLMENIADNPNQSLFLNTMIEPSVEQK